MSGYTKFLASKARKVNPVGHDLDPAEIHPMLHPFQREIVQWSVRTGRVGLFTTTGTGKTVMSLEYARLSGATSLVVAPLAVCQQTVREGAKLGLDVQYVRDGSRITGPGQWITNYEMVDRFDPQIGRASCRERV